VETLAFIVHNLPAIGERTIEHIAIVGVAVGVAILTGVPIGIAISQSQRAADTVLYLGSIVMTIPSIALPLIVGGVRVAVVINIGVTAIAAYIGAGGLGTFISRGISQTDVRQLVTGALALGLLAIAADHALLWLQRRLTPKGLRVEGL